MTRDDGTVGVAIKAYIALVVRGVAEKNTKRRAGGEFMWGGGGKVGIASAPKNSQVLVGGWNTK
jgi:hypothetical protein